MAASFVIALITAPQDVGALLARRLVERGLAAGVNVVTTAHSVYRWRDSIEEKEESLLIVRTVLGAVAPLTDLLGELLPYEKVVVLPLEGGSPSYLNWLAESVNLPEVSELGA